MPAAHAQTRITVPGAGPLYYPRIVTALPLGRYYMLGTRGESGDPLSLLEGYDELNHMVGENWFGPTTAQVVDYPASMGLVSLGPLAPVVDDAVETGRRDLDARIRTAAASEGATPVVIAGLSEGTLVVNRELAYLATDPDAPPKNSLSFVMFSDPELGVFGVLMPVGSTLPLVDYTAQVLPDSQYDVDVVYHQYDAWADFPDRPWNVLAVVNALLGTAYFHNSTAVASPDDTVEVSSVTSKLGGTTTTRMIPSSTVPMLKPLEQLGVPDDIVDALNSRLKPIVDAGYSRLTPDAGPHFSHGQLVVEQTPPASPKAVPSIAPVPNSVLRTVDAIRSGDNRRLVDLATRVASTHTRTTPGGRAGIGPLGVFTHVVDGVEKRLQNFATGASKSLSPSGESAGAPGSSAND
jgi:hypothetical protein